MGGQTYTYLSFGKTKVSVNVSNGLSLEVEPWLGSTGSSLTALGPVDTPVRNNRKGARVRPNSGMALDEDNVHLKVT